VACKGEGKGNGPYQGLLGTNREIAFMIETGTTSETSVNSYQAAWHGNPEDSHLHVHCNENFKSHILFQR
jgi:hypothetical protein